MIAKKMAVVEPFFYFEHVKNCPAVTGDKNYCAINCMALHHYGVMTCNNCTTLCDISCYLSSAPTMGCLSLPPWHGAVGACYSGAAFALLCDC